MITYPVYYHGRHLADIRTATPDLARDSLIRLFPIGATLQKTDEPPQVLNVAAYLANELD